MPKRPRRTFPPDFKARLVLDVLSGKHSQAELCRQPNLKPELLARWKTLFLERMALIVEDEEERTAAMRRPASRPDRRLRERSAGAGPQPLPCAGSAGSTATLRLLCLPPQSQEQCQR